MCNTLFAKRVLHWDEITHPSQTSTAVYLNGIEIRVWMSIHIPYKKAYVILRIWVGKRSPSYLYESVKGDRIPVCARVYVCVTYQSFPFHRRTKHRSLGLIIVSYPWLYFTFVGMEILFKARSRCHKDHRKGKKEEAFSVVIRDAPIFRDTARKTVTHAC